MKEKAKEFPIFSCRKTILQMSLFFQKPATSCYRYIFRLSTANAELTRRPQAAGGCLEEMLKIGKSSEAMRPSGGVTGWTICSFWKGSRDKKSKAKNMFSN